MLNIFGAYDVRDLLPVYVLDVTQFRVYEAIQAFQQQWTANMQRWLAALVGQSDDLVQSRYSTGFGGELQPLGEIADVEATNEGSFWDVGFPIYAYADRKIYTERYLDEATLWQVNKDVLDAAARDAYTVVRAALRSVMNHSNFTFNDTSLWGRQTGSLNVRRLANNDGAAGTWYFNGQELAIGSMNHYITSLNSSLDVNAFDLCRTQLRAKGLGEDIVYYVSRATADAAEALTGSGPKNFVRAQLPDQQGIINPLKIYSVVQNPKSRGRICYGELVEMPYMPDNYIIAIDRTAEKPLKQREHHLAKYRGFQLVRDETMPAGGTSDFLLNKRFRRVVGFGVNNRVNGVVCQVTNNGTYADPTFG